MKKIISFILLASIAFFSTGELKAIDNTEANKIVKQHIVDLTKSLKQSSVKKYNAEYALSSYYSKQNIIDKEVESKNTLRDASVYSEISFNDKTVSVLNNGGVIIDELKVINEPNISRAANKYVTVTNNWDYKALLGNTLIIHKFTSRFGYNGTTAWYMKGTAKGNAYAQYVMGIASKDIDGWNTAAKSRTARMYVVAYQNINGYKFNYMHTDTRVGVTKNGNVYKSTKVGGGV